MKKGKQKQVNNTFCNHLLSLHKHEPKYQHTPKRSSYKLSQEKKHQTSHKNNTPASNKQNNPIQDNYLSNRDYKNQTNLFSSLQHSKLSGYSPNIKSNNHKPKCTKHQKKTATHNIKIQNERVPFCSPCALKMNQNGFNIYKLDPQLFVKQKILKTNRLIIRELFKEMLEIKQYFQKIIQMLIQRMNQTNYQYEKWIKKHDQYYDEFIKIVQEEKRKSKQPIQQAKKLIFQEFNQNIKNLKDPLQQINHMIKYVKGNEQKLICQIKQQKIKQLINIKNYKYNELLNKIKQVQTIDIPWFAFQDRLQQKINKFKKIIQNFNFIFQNQNQDDSLLCSQKNNDENIKSVMFSFQLKHEQQCKEGGQNKLFRSPAFNNLSIQ